MYLLRYLGLGLATIIVAVPVSVRLYPETHFVQYVPQALQIGIVAMTVLTAVSLWYEDDLADRGKTVLMGLFLLAVMVPSIFTTVAFAHEGWTSWSSGEVHWHADFEVIVDGEELDLIDPEQFCATMSQEPSYMCKLNDRVGSTKYHDHDDDRLHVEGVFNTYDEATLAAFFDTFNGTLTNTDLRFPTNDGWVDRTAQDGKTLKVIIEHGVGSRTWCVIGDAAQLGVEQSDICIDPHTADYATSPSEYVVTGEERDTLSEVLLDKIFIIYDDTPAQQALQDLREDDTYTYDGKTFGITKEGGAD